MKPTQSERGTATGRGLAVALGTRGDAHTPAERVAVEAVSHRQRDESIGSRLSGRKPRALAWVWGAGPEPSGATPRVPKAN